MELLLRPTKFLSVFEMTARNLVGYRTGPRFALIPLFAVGGDYVLPVVADQLPAPRAIRPFIDDSLIAHTCNFLLGGKQRVRRRGRGKPRSQPADSLFRDMYMSCVIGHQIAEVSGDRAWNGACLAR